jgi:hypothetical protein
MAKRTGNSSLNSSIRQNSTTVDTGFKQLIDLQRLSIEHLSKMSDTLASSLVAERLSAVEQLLIARETDKEEDLIRSMDSTLKDMLDAIKTNITPISNTNITTNNQKSDTLINKSSSTTNTALAKVSEEDKNEKEKADKEQLSVLQTIARNTEKGKVPGAKNADGTDVSLGAIAAALAIALGGIVGAVRGWLKAIAYFADILTPTFVKKAIGSFFAGISMTFDLVKATLSEKFSKFVTIFDPIIDVIRKAFTSAGESKIGKVVSELFTWMGKVFDPIKSIASAFKEFFGGKLLTTAFDMFADLGKYIGSFSATLSKAASIFGKLFYPFTVVMTIWDTVKGAMEGFENEGIIGGIKGAITGFFNSLIFGPMDMIKDAIAWIAGVFGFDEAKKALESFSIEKMFKDFINMIFSPIDVLRGMMNKVTDFFESLKGFEIPGFSFKVPNWVPIIGGNETKFGPWKPLGNASQKNSTTGGSEASPVKPADMATPTSAGAAGNAQAVTNTSTQVNNMKEEKNTKATTIVSAPSVTTNSSTTQVASIKAPVRSDESSLGRYFSARAVF